ncbi:MAG: SLBB domain-containing protein [Sphingobacteriaceae bacterium]|nr:SLBB domain-containing protein [Sphingobacteriaceae bacterium]
MFKKIIFVFVLFFSVSFAFAQDITQVNVDQLTDEQIKNYLTQAQAAGVQVDQIESLAIAKGMAPSEAQKLVERINKLNGGMSTATLSESGLINKNEVIRIVNPDESKIQHTPQVEKPKAIATKLNVFGAALFENSAITFEPNLRLATPLNYQIGAQDQLLISVTGNSSVEWQPKVSPEGNINIPTVGFVSVNGLTIEQATARIKAKLIANKYAIGNGTNLAVNLGQVKSIKVTITGNGAKKPGTYTLSSLATVFNALYVSGGPSDNGSFRNIELIRNNKVIRKLDAYNFLTKGIQEDNITLRDQDVINIPTYSKRVVLNGQVKQPAIFEVVPSDRLKDVINYAGGFTNYAYTDRIKVLQVTGKERKIADLESAAFNTYQPQRGDEFFVDSILERYVNRVIIQGAVFRPGEFQLSEGLTLSQLIKKADGLKEDAFTARGSITRLKTDNTTELISFDLAAVLNGQQEDVKLQREDIVVISSLFDLKDRYKVTISGEVRTPGSFYFASQMSLEDLILKSGGFMEGASAKRIEISRRVKKEDATANNNIIAEIFTIDVENDLASKGASFKLQPFDRVMVRSQPGYEKQRMVKIEGEVLFPGYYALQSKDEKLSELIERAGGLTNFADATGGSLKRPGASQESEDKFSQAEIERENLEKQQKLVASTLEASKEVLKNPAELDKMAHQNVFVDINLVKILKHPNSKWDVIMEEGDVLRVPKLLQVVKINGEVLYPTARLYNKGTSFRGYIRQAGGYTQSALKRGYIIYSNGSVRSVKKFLGFSFYPKVKPGAEIIIPKAKDKKPMSPQEVLTLTTGVASFATIIIGLLNLIK